MLLSTPELFLLTLFFMLVGLAAAWDVAEFRIPNILNLTIAALYPAYVVGSSRPVDWVAATAIAALILLVGIALFCCGFMGGGDVKLLAAVALWAGPGAVVELLLLMAVAGGVIALAMTLARTTAVHLLLYRCGAGGLASAAAEGKVPYAVAIAIGVYLAVAPAALAVN